MSNTRPTLKSVLDFLRDYDVPGDQRVTLALAAQMVEKLYLDGILDETPFEQVAKDVAEDLSKAPFKKN